ncbi:hypothetical protein B0H13DRAFT_1853801 [Mycena leptocephala]|nr:hypothetical protein B0H13DRAFT_1853801 [Mycena leptocephala]
MIQKRASNAALYDNVAFRFLGCWREISMQIRERKRGEGFGRKGLGAGDTDDGEGGKDDIRQRVMEPGGKGRGMGGPCDADTGVRGGRAAGLGSEFWTGARQKGRSVDAWKVRSRERRMRGGVLGMRTTRKEKHEARKGSKTRGRREIRVDRGQTERGGQLNSVRGGSRSSCGRVRADAGWDGGEKKRLKEIVPATGPATSCFDIPGAGRCSLCEAGTRQGRNRSTTFHSCGASTPDGAQVERARITVVEERDCVAVSMPGSNPGLLLNLHRLTLRTIDGSSWAPQLEFPKHRIRIS